MEEIVDSVGSMANLSPEEREGLVDTIADEKNARWANTALQILAKPIFNESKALTPEEKGRLKQIILKTQDADAACLALLNSRNLFTKDELFRLRIIAYTTQNEYWAYLIYRNDCIALAQEPAARANLRKVVMNTKNPQRAFEFLRVQDEMRETYDDYAQSLEYTDDELMRFKEIIISSGDPQWSFRLLRTTEPKDPDDSTREDESVIELTPKERVALKRSIIESQSPEWSYDTLRSISDLTEGERMVLKGIFIRQIKNPSIACHVLCNTDFIHNLNEKERAILRELAVQVKDKFNAGEALKYIYDLTPDERIALEKIMHG